MLKITDSFFRIYTQSKFTSKPYILPLKKGAGFQYVRTPVNSNLWSFCLNLLNSGSTGDHPAWFCQPLTLYTENKRTNLYENSDIFSILKIRMLKHRWNTKISNLRADSICKGQNRRSLGSLWKCRGVYAKPQKWLQGGLATLHHPQAL